MSQLQGWLRGALWDVVPRDHRESDRDLRRRQLVTLAVVVLGAVVLGFSLRLDPGSRWFYATTLGLAGLWTGGAFASGSLHLGRIPVGRGTSRPVAAPIVLGLLLAGIFVAGAFLVRTLDFLDGLEGHVVNIIDFADQGSTPLLVLVTAVNGIAEELFFRGAAYAAIPTRPVLWTTAAYVAVTAASGNVMLTFAALLLSVLVGLERRASGGILGPILTHCTWSLTMLIALPLVF
ncbi:MAG: protease family protein [Nocardioidaceae bacterium]|jgi:membrane protease YdiL (CAAX protease family)|nr:protease family protein [Nocardioidaceae bacterium]